MDLTQRKSARELFAGKDNSGELPALEKIDDLLNYFLFVADDIDHSGTAVTDDQDLASDRLARELAHGVNPSLLQLASKVSAGGKRRAAVVGNYDDIGGITRSFGFQRSQNPGEVFIRVANCGKGLLGAGSGLMLRPIGLVHP